MTIESKKRAANEWKTRLKVEVIKAIIKTAQEKQVSTLSELSTICKAANAYLTIQQGYLVRIELVGPFSDTRRETQAAIFKEIREVYQAVMTWAPVWFKTIYFFTFAADVAELVDAHDSKSCGGNSMWVRFPPSAPEFKTPFHRLRSASLQLGITTTSLYQIVEQFRLRYKLNFSDALDKMMRQDNLEWDGQKYTDVAGQNLS
jgi:hypothetical protein